MPKTILVTGASSGIGRAAAELFQAKGWNVIATMRDPGAAGKLEALDRVLVPRLDVTDTGSIAEAVSAGMQRFGALDALVNNAGYGGFGPLEAAPSDSIRRQFETNVIGLLEVTKAVLPIFRAQRAGVVVNISSMGGRIAFPLGALYHGSKFAVEGLSEALQYELGEIGVRVRLIQPGMVKTNFGGRSLDFNNDERLVEYQSLVSKQRVAFGAMAEQASMPETIADAIWRAVNDKGDRLRYIAGPDAEVLIGKRLAEDDATFFGDLRKQMLI